MRTGWSTTVMGGHHRGQTGREPVGRGWNRDCRKRPVRVGVNRNSSRLVERYLDRLVGPLDRCRSLELDDDRGCSVRRSSTTVGSRRGPTRQTVRTVGQRKRMVSQTCRSLPVNSCRRRRYGQSSRRPRDRCAGVSADADRRISIVIVQSGTRGGGVPHPVGGSDFDVETIATPTYSRICHPPGDHAFYACAGDPIILTGRPVQPTTVRKFTFATVER